MPPMGSDGEWVQKVEVVSGSTGGPGGGTSNTTEATQLAVKAAVEAINTKTPALSGGAVPVAVAGVATADRQDTQIAAIGAPADGAAAADDSAVGIIALIKRGLARWTTLLGRLPTALGAKTAANSFPVVIASDQAAVGVAPQLSSGGHIAAQTAVSGTTYTAFASQACKQLTILNGTGVDIGVTVGGAGVEVPVLAGTYYTFFGITNANQLSVRRVDTSTTQVTVAARWES
ncbi:hypothetical protein [Zoogloea dura]|uniref:Phage tail protein n=1 Tax=Zoogloea dura TaxID=2728840 RepID=A0A848FWW9_9RHOO|nr:hypothetical protein [Zoogloea dura]NML24338.1 hypothetical protein [Zoogloea dura]